MFHQARRWRLLALGAAVGLAGCRTGSREPPAPSEPHVPAPAPAPVPAPPPAPDGAPGPAGCETLPFAAEIPIAEASGAIWMPAAGADPAHILIVADSGNSGDLIAIDPDSGGVLATGRLPLDRGASDDLEGLTYAGGTLYAITSSGWMREYRRRAGGGLADFDAAAPAYPIAPVGSGHVCAMGQLVNCGPNYEGLCLRPDGAPGGGCAGVAVAKDEGTLWCLVRDARGHLAVDDTRSLRVIQMRGALAGCDYAPDRDELWVGSNRFDDARVYRVTGTADLATARVEQVAELGPGFPEAMAVAPGGVIYRFSDTGGAPSAMTKHRCPPPPSE